ncbi:MAG: primosomal protein [Euryarchaeota archaeon]|nr:primosomal protein [Euryarchaeota archaeon]
MKLISEFNDYAVTPVIVEENENGKKDYFIEGIFMQSEIKNRNGRIYPKEVIQKEVKRYNKEFVEQDRAFGELGHPEGPTINLDKVSHMITKLEEDGNNFVGRAKILSTPNGQIVKNLIDDGAKLGVSSRGLGSLESKGNAQYVKDDFQLATAGDIVADPSAPEAFVEGIMEGVEWVYESGILKAKDLDQMQLEMKAARFNQLEETKLKLWKRFVENL